jgi:hypothetical protein
MERATVKKVLLFCKNIDSEISLNNGMIRDYENRYYSLSGGVSESQVKRNSMTKRTETIALNVPGYVSKEINTLTERNEQLDNLKAEIMKEINKLPYHKKSALYFFYIKGLRWIQISERIQYSTDRCKQIRNIALDELGEKFSENELIEKFNYPD